MWGRPPGKGAEVMAFEPSVAGSVTTESEKQNKDYPRLIKMPKRGLQL